MKKNHEIVLSSSVYESGIWKKGLLNQTGHYSGNIQKVSKKLISHKYIKFYCIGFRLALDHDIAAMDDDSVVYQSKLYSPSN